MLIGTLLGGCIGIAIEIVRSRNERRQRLMDDRRRASVRLLALAGRLTYEARALALRLPNLPGDDPDSPIDLADLPEGPARATSERFVRLFDELREVYEEVRLLSDDGVGRAAGHLFISLSNLGRAARSPGAGRADNVAQVEKVASRARRQLRELLRGDLRG